MKNGRKTTKGRGQTQMLDDLFENKGDEALKRTTEDRSTWRTRCSAVAERLCNLTCHWIFWQANQDHSRSF